MKPPWVLVIMTMLEGEDWADVYGPYPNWDQARQVGRAYCDATGHEVHITQLFEPLLLELRTEHDRTKPKVEADDA